MSGYRRSNYRRNGAASRWMNLKYAGTCKVCGDSIPVGALAYWDQSARTVTCHRIDCADADGLTTDKPLTGPWDKRADLRERTDHRIGSAAPTVVVTRLNSGAVTQRNARGRCIDAPCCGCCD